MLRIDPVLAGDGSVAYYDVMVYPQLAISLARARAGDGKEVP